VGLAHSAERPQLQSVCYECLPFCHSNKLPLAQQSKLNNNPYLSNSKGDNSEQTIKVKSIQIAQSTQISSSGALTFRIRLSAKHDRCRQVSQLSNGY
jgi:hypothetical protein